MQTELARSKRRMRRSRHASVSGQSRGQIVEAISIRERPPEVEDRAIPGHGEGDLLSGAKNSYMATLVERHFALCYADPGAQQRHRSCRCRTESTCAQTPRYPATLADVGPRVAEGQAQDFHGSHGGEGLLLRSAKSLAARHERKHQSTVTALLPPRHRPVCLFSSAARPSRTALESTTEKDLRIPDSRK
jgi:hypothetical protein